MEYTHTLPATDNSLKAAPVWVATPAIPGFYPSFEDDGVPQFIRPSRNGSRIVCVPKNPSNPDNLIEITLPGGITIKVDHGGDRANELLDAQTLVAQIQSRSPSFKDGDGPSNGPVLTIREVVDQYIQDKLDAGEWQNKKTRTHEVTRIERVLTLLDVSRPFSNLTRDDAKAVRKGVVTLPDTRYKPKPDGTQKTITLQTAHKHFILFRSICTYAWREGYHDQDIANGITFNLPSKTAQERQPFTKDDVQALLKGPIHSFTPLKSARELEDWHFWILPVALYTGARLNELAQLKVADVEQQDGIWCFQFRVTSDSQSLKNKSSERTVPVHDTLIKLGFIDFIQHRQAQAKPTAQLFSGLNWDRHNGWGKKISDWFNGNGKMHGYLHLVGLTSTDNKAFHSTRHTVTRSLRDQGITDEQIAAILGHEKKTTTSRYGGGYSTERLRQIVNTIDYGIDLSHLDFATYAFYRECRGRPDKASKYLREKYAHLNLPA